MKLSRSAIVSAAVVAAATVSLFAFSSPASAAVCRGRMAGEGTGTGLLGQGTSKARQNALDNWASSVAAKHGQRFANTAKARSVKYDCKQGAILQAKCAVTAIPCR
jgi:hypothetical protein